MSYKFLVFFCSCWTKKSLLFCIVFRFIYLFWIQDASEALFLRSAFKNVVFNATEGVKKESQSASLNKSLDPEGIILIIIYIKSSWASRSVQSTDIWYFVIKILLKNNWYSAMSSDVKYTKCNKLIIFFKKNLPTSQDV